VFYIIANYNDNMIYTVWISELAKSANFYI